MHRPRANRCGSVLAAALSLATAAGCADTWVDVYFDAETEVAARAVQFAATVTDQDGSVVFERAVSDPTFPSAIRVRPLGGDASRSFLVEGELRDDAGAFAEVRRQGAFIDGMQSRLDLRFEDACADVRCPPGQSCSAGSCSSVPTDAGLDGGVDAPAEDAPADSPSDTGLDTDAPVPVTPGYVFDGVDRFTVRTQAVVPLLSGEEPFVMNVPDAAENWLLLVTARLGTNDFRGNSVRLHVDVDGTLVARGTAIDPTGGDPSAFGVFRVVSAGATVSFQASGRDGSVGTVEDLRAALIPLPDAPFVSTQDDDVAIPMRPFRAVLALDSVPPGDYLVMATVEVDRGSVLAGAELRLSDPSGNTWPASSEFGPRDFLAVRSDSPAQLVLARQVTLSSTGSFALEAQLDLGDDATVRRAQIAAIPISSFRYAGQEVLETQVETEGAPVAAMLSVDPATRGTVVFASATPSGASDLAAAEYSYEVVHRVDGQPDQVASAVASGQTRVPRTAFWLIPPGEGTNVSVTSRSPPGNPIETKEIVIHALGLL